MLSLLGFRKRGYALRVATHRNFAQFVAQQGIEFAPIAGNFKEILGSEAGYQLLEGKNVKLVEEDLSPHRIFDLAARSPCDETWVDFAYPMVNDIRSTLS